MTGVPGKNELVMVVLGAQSAGEILVGKHPVVHPIAHDVGVEQIKVANLHPDADGLGGRVGDEVLGELPGAVWSFGVGGPLLINPRARVGEDAVVELVVIPRHDQGAGGAGAAAGGGTGVGIVSELDVRLGFHTR